MFRFGHQREPFRATFCAGGRAYRWIWLRNANKTLLAVWMPTRKSQWLDQYSTARGTTPWTIPNLSRRYFKIYIELIERFRIPITSYTITWGTFIPCTKNNNIFSVFLYINIFLRFLIWKKRKYNNIYLYAIIVHESSRSSGNARSMM